jgi:hypothetical protein
MRIFSAALIAMLSAPALAAPLLITPDRVWDGEATHPGWQVLVDGRRRGERRPLIGTAATSR